MTEVKLSTPDLRLSVRRALAGKVTGNLAGLYATKEAQEIRIVACFFAEATELDRKYIESAAGMVAADYPDDYMVATEYTLISEIDPYAVHWQFLRAEILNFAGDPS